MTEKYFKKRKIEPNPINKFHSLGIYYFKIEKYQKAIECFKKLLIIDPDHLDSKNKIELLVKKLEGKENHLNGENLLESNNIKEQEEITFVNIPKNEKIVKKHKRLSESEIKHYQNILQLYGKYGTIGFPKKDNHIPKSRLEDKFILRESITRDSSDKEEQGAIAYGGIQKDNKEIPVKKLRKLSSDKVDFSKTIFQLYNEYLKAIINSIGNARENSIVISIK